MKNVYSLPPSSQITVIVSSNARRIFTIYVIVCLGFIFGMLKCNAVLSNCNTNSEKQSDKSAAKSNVGGPFVASKVPNCRPRSLSRKPNEDSENGDRQRRSSLYLFRNSAYRRDLFAVTDFDIVSSIGVGTFGDVFLCSLSSTSPIYAAVSPEFQQSVFALKVMPIRHVIAEGQVAHVKNERRILACLDHPFVVRLFWSGHTSAHLFLLMEFVPGGELFSYMKTSVFFDAKTACFYAAEIVSALDYLHAYSIAYRDLKPENCLLDAEGHVKLTDFGFAKLIRDRSYTLCGTPDYLAPEQLASHRGHSSSVDWWALGILIYEMLTGYTPFADASFEKICENILEKAPEFPQIVDAVSRDLITRLLIKDRCRRLGCLKNRTDDVKRHKWFAGVVTSWNDVRARKLIPPIVPRLRNAADISNYAGSMIQDSLKSGDMNHNNSNTRVILDFDTSPGGPVAPEEVDLFSDF